MENFREILNGSGIYRSKLLIDLTDKDKDEMVNKYHIKTVVDLRSKEERERLPDVIVDGVNYVCIPLTNSKAVMTREIIKNGMSLPDLVSAYKELAKHDKAEYWTKIFDVLLENNKGDGILFHCASGKDRTGIVSAIILALLGLDKDYIYHDYFLTNDYKDEYFLNHVNQLPEEYRQTVKDHFAARKEYLDAFFEQIRNEYGDIDNFFFECCSLTKEKIALLKEKYGR